MFRRPAKSMRLVFALIFILSMLGMPPQITSAAAPASSPSPLMHFTSGGHALGFAADGMYAASGSHALHVEFVGAKRMLPQAAASETTQGASRPLDMVTYEGLWPGISLAYSAGGIYTTTYTLAPGAGVADIRLHYSVPPSLNEDGTLGIALATGTFTENAPIAWQEIAGRRVSVQASFRVEGQQVSFAVGTYDPRYTLTIDPTLNWLTFMGGITGDDRPNAIALDGSGNIYVVGMSSAAGWGPTPILPHTDGWDAFVAKLDPSGALVWYTFMGVTGQDAANDIAVDASGNAYVAGYSPLAWTCQPSCPTARAFNAGDDAFVAKLDSAGAMQWNTFLGGGGDDLASGIARDGLGNLYVGGYSDQTWGTSVPRAYDSLGDGFVAKLDTATGNLSWNTFLGGGGVDSANDVALYGTANVYAAGISEAAWTCSVSLDCTARDYTAGRDAFVGLLDGATGALTWNSFLGAAGSDSIRRIVLDASGNAYVTGYSDAAWGCEPEPPCTVRAYSADWDAFAAKLNASGGLVWNTFLGGAAYDTGWDLALDARGNLYVVGTSLGSWGSPLRAYTPGVVPVLGDGFAAKLGPSGTLAANLFMGSDRSDRAEAVALDSSGRAYVAGESAISWDTPINPHSGYQDVFVSRTDLGLYVPSAGSKDGWILESSENSNTGGTKNGGGTTLRLGDDAGNKQYRAILSFNTADLPDNAVIESASLQIKNAGRVGTNPFKILGNLRVDVRKGAFSNNSALQLGDFSAAAHHNAVMSFTNTLVNNWYSKSLAGTEFNHINKLGLTQFRLRFAKDDNNDGGADYLKVYSGNALSSADAPQLIIVFSVP